MFGFLLKELARTTVASVLARTLIALVVGAIVTVAVGIVALVTSNASAGRLLVLFRTEVSSDQINAVYRQVRAWQTVSEVRYIPPEDPEHTRDLPEAGRVRAGYLSVTARWPTELSELEADLLALSGVEVVVAHRSGALAAALATFAEPLLLSWGVPLLGALLAVGLFLTVLRALRDAWAGELETLYLAGVPMRTVRVVFFAWTLGMGAISALLGLLIMALLRSMVSTSLWLPELEQLGGARHATLVMLGFAGSVSMSAGLLGWLVIRTKR